MYKFHSHISRETIINPKSNACWCFIELVIKIVQNILQSVQAVGAGRYLHLSGGGQSSTLPVVTLSVGCGTPPVATLPVATLSVGCGTPPVATLPVATLSVGCGTLFVATLPLDVGCDIMPVVTLPVGCGQAWGGDLILCRPFRVCPRFVF